MEILKHRKYCTYLFDPLFFLHLPLNNKILNDQDLKIYTSSGHQDKYAFSPRSKT